MAIYPKRIPFPVMVIGGSLCLVLSAAVLVRFVPQMARRVYVYRAIAPTKTDTSINVQATTTVPEIAVAISGNLMQSIPPSWTFVQKLDSLKTVTAPLNGLTAEHELVITSLETGRTLRLVEYGMTDLVGYKKDVKTKARQEVLIGKVSFHVLSPAKGTGVGSLIIEGTTKAVIISSEDGKPWSSVSVLASELRDLVQSIRVQ